MAHVEKPNRKEVSPLAWHMLEQVWGGADVWKRPKFGSDAFLAAVVTEASAFAREANGKAMIDAMSQAGVDVFRPLKNVTVTMASFPSNLVQKLPETTVNALTLLEKRNEQPLFQDLLKRRIDGCDTPQEKLGVLKGVQRQAQQFKTVFEQESPANESQTWHWNDSMERLSGIDAQLTAMSRAMAAQIHLDRALKPSPAMAKP